MNKEDLKAITSFAKANGMMNWAFEDVLNEYLTTKEVAESYENFSYYWPIDEINNALSLLAEIAVSEMEQSGSSINHTEVINHQLATLPEDVRNHFIDLWVTIGRAADVLTKKRINC